jgi:hypothetical protein
VNSEHSDQVFKSAGYQVHHWAGLGESSITVLQKEPFRLSWLATQLVTFVFLIRRPVEAFAQVLDDYPALRSFAGEHQRTFLPVGIQCGYALLPIYMAHTFPEALIESTRSTYKKRWCVFYIPSLFNLTTQRVIALERRYFWGCIYRGYIGATIQEAANMISGRTDAPS